MNIIDYLKKNNDLSLEELPFNDVDSLILSELAYMNFNYYVPRLCDSTFIGINEMRVRSFEKFSYGSVDHKQNVKLFKLLKEGNRFKDLKVGLYKEGLASKVNRKNKQFFAVTFLLPNNTLYLAFRGTDITINGWKEDFHLCLLDTIPSQDEALKYTKKVTSKFKLPFYLGGHSKGGNLANYSALNLNSKRLEKRLINSYSFDGPGFKNGIKNFPSYEAVRKKIIKYITHRDTVGMIYNEVKRGVKVVSASGFLLGGHDPFTWKVHVKSATFVSGKRSAMYRNSEIAFNKWLSSLSIEDKVLACDMIFDLLGDTKTVYDLPSAIRRTISSYKEVMANYSEEEINRVKNVVKQLVKEYLKVIFGRKKKRKKIEKE